MEQLIEYYCVGIWGGYDYGAGTFTWNPSEPENSTYEIGGVTHTAGEIFNNTWFRNTYEDGNHRFVITNTPDTSPPVFIVTDVGVDTVAMATGILAGIAKLYNEVENSNTDGGVTQAAVKVALAAEESRASEAENGLAGGKQDKIPAQTGTGGQVLLAPSAAGGTPAQEPLTDFVRAGVPASADAGSGATALIIDSLAFNYYNEGARINAAAGNKFAGIVLGGKPGTVQMVDEPGYGANQNDFETRRATWFAASASNGDFVISQDSNALPDNSLKGLLLKRTGEAYLQGGQRIVTPQFVSSSKILLTAPSLGVPANGAATAEKPLFYMSERTLTLVVDKVNRICSLNGYLSIWAQFTGGWDMPLIIIPNSVLPAASVKMYVMGVASIHFTASVTAQIKPPAAVSFYLGCPVNPANGGTTPFNIRFSQPGAISAGYYNEVFFDTTWTY
jgi:hypothetical protein